MKDIKHKIIILTILTVLLLPLTVFGEVKYEGDPEKLKEPVYKDGIMIVNKQNPLPSSYKPELKSTDGGEGDPEAVEHLEKLLKKAKKDGMNLKLYSGYRSYDRQVELYDSYVKRDGKEEADKYSARAGFSEHQTGLTFDIDRVNADPALSTSLGEKEEGKWIAKNAHKYGFIIRYPKGKEDITGYQYEPWHIRYIGKDKAKELYDSEHETLEEFLGIVGKVVKKDDKEDKEEKEEKKEDGVKIDKNKKDKDNTYAKGMDSLVDREIATNFGGLKDRKNVISGDMQIMGIRVSNNLVKVFQYVGIFLVAVAFVYTSLSLLAYLVISKNGGSSKTIDRLEKVTGTSMERSRQTLVKLLLRFMLVLAIIVIYLTGQYVQIQKLILMGIENFLTMF